MASRQQPSMSWAPGVHPQTATQRCLIEVNKGAGSGVSDRWLTIRRFVIQSRNEGYPFGCAMMHQDRTSGSQRCELPAAPKGVTIYAIGDIHGRLDLLDTVHGEIDADRA